MHIFDLKIYPSPGFVSDSTADVQVFGPFRIVTCGPCLICGQIEAKADRFCPGRPQSIAGDS